MVGRFKAGLGVYIDTGHDSISVRLDAKLWNAPADEFKQAMVAAREKIEFARDMDLLDCFYFTVYDVPENVIAAIERISENPFASAEQKHEFSSFLEEYRAAQGKKLINRAGNKTLRQQVIARDSLHCRFCGDPVPKNHPLEHIIPYTLGGKTEYDNLVVACVKCNSHKSGRTPEQAGMTLLPLRQ